jgi:aminomethyltransferase
MIEQLHWSMPTGRTSWIIRGKTSSDNGDTMADQPTPGYEALMSSAALIDLSKRGRIRVTGEDRARLLHAMCTNHVQQMKPGDGLYTFFLNAQGRILADACILCFEDHLLLDTESATRESLMAHLDQYIIADDVTLEDISDETFSFGIEGPKAIDVAARCGLEAPHHRGSHVRAEDLTVANIAATGLHGVRIYGPVRDKEETIAKIEAGGAIAASAEDAETTRIENFVLRFGPDISDHTLPQETQQSHALHFQKGCYLGQEIVERIRSRGHVNRLLMGFRMEGASVAPAPGTKLIVEGQPSGEVTSSAVADGAVFGIALVRAPGAKSGAMAEINGQAAALFQPRD